MKFLKTVLTRLYFFRDYQPQYRRLAEAQMNVGLSIALTPSYKGSVIA